jgi:hypothetical protein
MSRALVSRNGVGMKLAASLYGPIIKRIKITDVRTQGNTASGVARLGGTPMATFQMPGPAPGG